MTLRIGPMVLLGMLVALATIPDHLPIVGLVERLLQDVRVAWLSAPVTAHPRIVVVTIGEATLERTRRRSPIDRRFLAKLLRRLDHMNATAIGVDILIDQPSEPRADEALRRVLRRMRTTTRFALADPTVEPERVQAWQRAYQRRFFAGMDERVGLAAVDLWLDADGVVRRLPPPRSAPPAMAADLAVQAGATEPLPVGRIVYERARNDGGVPITALPAEIVIDADERQMDALRDAFFAGRVVLVGADLPDADRHRTPIATVTGTTEAGVMVHARLLAQYLDGRQHAEVSMTFRLLIAVLVVGAGYALGVVTRRTAAHLAIAAAGVVILWAAAFVAYAGANPPGPLVPLAGPTLAWGGALSVGVLVSRSRFRAERNYISRALDKFVPASVADALRADPRLLRIGGEAREITALFTDVAGFTSLAEELDPQAGARLLNDYLEGMTRVIHAHGGTLDKYIGDGVVAFWGAPLDVADPAGRAIDCALALDVFATAFAQRHSMPGAVFGHTRIGVHTGPVIVGNFGGQERYQYTAIGDTMNLASRLEGANKYIGTHIAISGATIARSGRRDVRPIGEIVVSGRRHATVVWSPCPEMSAADRERYIAAYDLMAAGDRRAIAAFETLHQAWPDDPLVQYHWKAAQAGRLSVQIVLSGK